ncbi:MAG TPA: thiamine ABC transporter substrate-binding protein [Acidimicrobiales bacterium]|nr:thiamine ABC transporter substrate-binding protein [Acidimicrobiales bacterium]
MKTPRPLVLLAAAALVATACGDDDDAATQTDAGEPVSLTLVTHDSFDVSDEVLAAFTEDTGIEVRLLPSGDAGSMVNQAILTKGSPQGDVLFGIDSTFLSRALDEGLFVPYESPALEEVDPSLVLDPEHHVTPIDIGDVCLNYDKAGLEAAGLAPPTSLADLTDPAYAGTLVVEDPSTSSPGLAHLLATVAEFGEDGWQEHWRTLRENDVEVAAGWEEAYYGSFSGSAGSSGDRPIVVSYASSPPAEVIFAEEPLDEAPTGVVEASCYRQIEFAGILEGTEHEDEAGQLIDFLLSETFQADIPQTMFVYPVIDVELPEEFLQHGASPEDPYLLDPDVVAEHRDDWIAEWTEIVLR